MGDILGYARVSTGDQDVAGQTMRLEKAGAIKIFTDVISGKSMERPGLAELIAYARKGDTLAVVRLDRLGRSLAELLTTVETLRGQGIALLSLEEKIDTSSAAGELIFHVFGAIAHFERRLISERTRDGIAAARAKGKQPGRQPLDMSKVDAAIKLVEARISPTEAARQLGIGRSTIYREMRRALLQRLAAVRGRLSLCADQAAAAKWWLSMPMASVSAEGPMPKALSTRRTSPLMPGCRHQGRACPLRRARMTSNPLIVA